jgi:hypothetical protein
MHATRGKLKMTEKIQKANNSGNNSSILPLKPKFILAYSMGIQTTKRIGGTMLNSSILNEK